MTARKRSSLEQEMKSLLDACEIPYREQADDLPGTPDFIVGHTAVGRPGGSVQVALFVDGTYWHDRPEARVRDDRVDRELRAQGFCVLRYCGQNRTFRLPRWQIVREIASVLI